MSEFTKAHAIFTAAVLVFGLSAAHAEETQTATLDCAAAIEATQKEAETADLRAYAEHHVERYLALAENSRKSGKERRCLIMVERARKKL